MFHFPADCVSHLSPFCGDCDFLAFIFAISWNIILENHCLLVTTKSWFKREKCHITSYGNNQSSYEQLVNANDLL